MVDMLNFRSCIFYNKSKYNFQTNKQKHLSHCWRFPWRRTCKIQEKSKLELSSLQGPSGTQTYNNTVVIPKAERHGTWDQVQGSQGLHQRPIISYLITVILSSSSSLPLEELNCEHPKGKGILHSALPR